MSKRCVMGCPDAENLHVFPRNPVRRDEWLQALRVHSNVRSLYICSRHFSDGYIFGNKLSKFAIPDKNLDEPYCDENLNSKNSESTPSVDLNINNDYNANEKSKSEIENKKGESQFPTEDVKGTKESQETISKVEDFEIRKGSTNDMIIKGRFVQTNNYLMVSYTPPKKWSMQNQIKVLHEYCTKQLTQIEQLNKEKHRLRMELQKYDKLLPKFRFLQINYRLLCAKFKMHQLTLKNRSKRKKKNKPKKMLDIPVVM